MSNPKQIIVMRTDLKMRKGKMIAQGAHASMKVFLDSCHPQHMGVIVWEWVFSTSHKQFKDWIEGSFTKVCVQVGSEAELDAVYEAAQAANLPCALIVDLGKTEFHGALTKTCCAIGPAYPEQLNPVTGHLKLL